MGGVLILIFKGVFKMSKNAKRFDVMDYLEREMKAMERWMCIKDYKSWLYAQEKTELRKKELRKKLIERFKNKLSLAIAETKIANEG
jgi:hypothetical protein